MGKKNNKKMVRVNTKVKINKDEIKSVVRKISKRYFIFLVVMTLFVFLLSYIFFGGLIALFSTVLFVLIIMCTKVLDNNPKNSPKRKIIKSLMVFILIVGILGIVAFTGFFTYIVIKSPEFDVEKLDRNETSLVYDKDNKLIATLGSEKREKITYDEMPEVLVNAIVATEDSRYFQHNGLDAPRFLKATLGQLVGSSGAGGASTITMQVAKNNFTSNEATGIEGIMRKFTDIYLSIFKIEKAFTKEEILEFYVNVPYLGGSSYGVEQACQTYFGKSTKDINLAEASIIAGLFQAPTAYDPLVYPESTRERQETVLSLMVKHGYITNEEKEIVLAIPIENLLKSSTSRVQNEYQDYIDYVLTEIKERTNMDPYITPMIIYTNMDSTKQLAVRKVFDGDTYTWPNKTIEGGAVAIESNTGKIIAIAGARNRTGERIFSYATDIKRQIGSTAKPLFDYGPGIEYLNWSTGHIFNDKVHYYSGSTEKIVNYDLRYLGPITLRYALADSRNVPAVEAFQALKNSQIKEFVTTLGIEPELDENGYIHEAHALGAFNGASPLQMAAAYAAFSNGGYYYEPYAVNKIVLRETNETIDGFEGEKVKAMSDSTAYMITDILKQPAISTGVNSAVKDQVALKTGTTNYDTKTTDLYNYPSNATPDGWIAGYTTNISMAMWTGYNENVEGQYIVQSKMVTHRNGLYKALAKAVFDNKGTTFTKPSSVVAVKIEKGTELLPSSNTPSSMIITELFKRGTEPTEQSSKYKSIENVSGLKVSYSNGTAKITWNSVSYPSDTDKSKYGELGYFVYYNNTELGFTTNNYYNYSTNYPYGTYTVKTSYEKSQSTKSSGSTFVLSANIEFIFNGDTNVVLSVGSTYTETKNPITVKYEGVDVTSDVSIIKTITDISNNKTVYSIDTSKAGQYQISYTATYKDESKTFTKNVTIN